ncbi:DUF7373 family lipoprotein [Nocardia sp. NPDC003963]
MLLRLPDAKGAQAMMRDSEGLNGLATPLASPPGIPGAFCQRYEQNIPRYMCFVADGRYFATVTGHDLESAHQMAAAQYALLVASR